MPTAAFELLPGARELLALHARELPQRDDLCGAFCGALALRAAGVRARGREPLDQDAVALAAGSVVCAMREAGTLPGGEVGRRDYRLQIPVIDDEETSGTAASGVQRALEELSEGAVRALPFAGPWTPATLDALFDALIALGRPTALIANHATRYLWGSRPHALALLDYLLQASQQGPPPDWDVGHFACVIGRISGPRGNLYALADTYPALGVDGVHLQPRERLAAALERREKPSGGMLVVVAREDEERARAGALGAGLEERMWDNGSVTSESLR
jgi:hypothetical protein